MPERGRVEWGEVEPDTAGRGGAGQGAAERHEVGYADSLPALLLLAPALLLLRHLGEHGWAYWTAVALAVPGVAGAVFGIAVAVGSLRRGRRRLLALYTIALLVGACFVLVARLVER